MSPTFMDAVLEGDYARAETEAEVALPEFFRGERWGHLKHRLGLVRADPDALDWLTRLMVLRDPGQVAGHIGFHEPPHPEGWVEVGYTVFPGHRRQGYAEGAVRGLFEWACHERGICRFRASVGPWNQPSLNLVRKLGFEQTGVQMDAVDGEELVFEVDWPRA